jgi:methionyl aminopeptidase
LDALRRPALRTRDEIERIREAERVVEEVLSLLALAAVPGVTTGELDRLAEARARAQGARPAFLGYKGYPASLCVSVNDEVIHGIPSPRRALQAGDVVGLDFGVELRGWYADSALTVRLPVPDGPADPKGPRLVETTRRALERGIAMARPEGTLGGVGAAIQALAEGEGFSVVRDFVGHGIGRALHEPPQVPNYGAHGTGLVLREGMVLAIEPMLTAGRAGVRMLDDGWTAVTLDGSLAAHFEHTVAVTANGPEILTLP